MALVLADRVQVTTSTTGTGTLTLGAAVTGFQDFTVIGDGNITYYAITNNAAWEVGIGTYMVFGTTLARTIILSNSNGDTSPITLSGASNVFVTYPAGVAATPPLPSQTSNAGKYLQTDGFDATWEDAQEVLSGATLTAVTVATDDKVLVQDASDSDNLKSVTAQSIAALSIGKQTVFIPSGAMKARSTNGAGVTTVESATNKIMSSFLAFDTSTQEYAQFSIQMPKSWNAGVVTVQFAWTANSTSTNSVVWSVRAVSLANDETIDTTWGTAVKVTDANTATVYQLHLSSVSAAVTVAGAAESELVIFEISRDVADGSDTLAFDALLSGVSVFYTTDSVNDA